MLVRFCCGGFVYLPYAYTNPFRRHIVLLMIIIEKIKDEVPRFWLLPTIINNGNYVISKLIATWIRKIYESTTVESY